MVREKGLRVLDISDQSGSWADAEIETNAMLHTTPDELEGRWRVERLGGLLPPMVGVSKEIRGRRGKVSLGPLPGPPFRVETRGGRVALVYRPPLSMLKDELEAGSGDAWLGRTLLGGRELGRFRMTRAEY